MKLKTIWFLKKSRTVRSQKLKDVASKLRKRGITADHLTLLSFLAGLVAVFFLFRNHKLFILFGIIHLFFDGIDGVVARLTKVTVFGTYFDFITDGLIGIFLLAKTFMVVNDYYIIVFIFLTIFTQMIYFFSHFTYPILFIRTTTMIIYMFNFITLGYLIVGVLSLYSLILQLHHYVKIKLPKANNTTKSFK